MFNDEYLGYGGTVFVAARRFEPRIRFREFLEDPWGSDRSLPPRQVQVAQALWRRWEPETDESEQMTPEPDEKLVLMEEKECDL